MRDTHPGQTLATFAATLRLDTIPPTVLDRAEDLLLDWIGSALAGKGARPVETIAVKTGGGRTLQARVDEPKGDPGNTLTRAELEDKALRLAAYRGGANAAQMQRVIERIRTLRTTSRVGIFLD